MRDEIHVLSSISIRKESYIEALGIEPNSVIICEAYAEQILRELSINDEDMSYLVGARIHGLNIYIEKTVGNKTRLEVTTFTKGNDNGKDRNNKKK